MTYPNCLRIQGLLCVVQVTAAATNCFPAQKNSIGFVYIIFCDLETSNRGGLSRIWAAQQHQKKKFFKFWNCNIICRE